MSTNGRSSTRGSKKSEVVAKPVKDTGFLGYTDLVELFTKLANNKSLFQSYIFFGESSVGKFTFAKRLANYLEFGSMAHSTVPNSESITISVAKDKESIGIDMIRDMKHFLSEQPSASAYRTVIIDGAQYLTDQAQNALLKISEESTDHGLLILIVDSPENLLPTLQSRFHKVYFPRLSEDEIVKHLKSEFKLSEDSAKDIAHLSFGRMGRAIQLAEDADADVRKDALKALKDKAVARKLIADSLDEPERLNGIIREMIAVLAKEPVRNEKLIKELIKRTTINAMFNTNKRMQLEAAIWNI